MHLLSLIHISVIDTVEYKNVIPGKTYTLKGSLHVKVTDEEGNVTCLLYTSRCV